MVAAFSGSDDLQGAEFTGVNLRGARFRHSDLSGAVLRSVDAQGASVDSPWLLQPGGEFIVNGVNVMPYVNAQLDKRFPGRETRNATTPDGLRDAWDVLQRSWAATLERVARMPDGTTDVSVDGEWSFAETLRHLVLATDLWLGKAILRREQPFHPLGLVYTGGSAAFAGVSFATEKPSYPQVLEARAGRVAMVTDYLADLTSSTLAESRRNPHAPDGEETVLSCLHTILEEEWEHHRYAVRDLDQLR